MYTDVIIIGAGPAGLATAIAARAHGMGVLMIDHATPPIDKACGEGIMPDGLASLAALGVIIPRDAAFPFRGIRFLENEVSVEAIFPHGEGYGIRRTVLHDLLVRKALEAGVGFLWGARVTAVTNAHVIVDGCKHRSRWIVGADGQNSFVRRTLGIRSRTERCRFGFRKHFAIQPWSDHVEVYWSDWGQVYVTPVATNEVCVALISADSQLRLQDLPKAFPELAMKLARAPESSREQGAITATRQLDSVSVGNVALVGEASGSVDAVTGEGMSLGFQQAVALANAMQAGSLESYECAHKSILSAPRNMARFMLTLGTHRKLRHRSLRALASQPDLFAQMLRLHIGASPLRDFGLQRTLALGWSMLTA